jgi:hypothetical protein
MDGFQIHAPFRMSLLLAAILLLGPSPTHSAEATAAKKPAATTRKVVGRALDTEGRPVAGAMVCLTRYDDSDDDTSEPIVIAQSWSQADGRFELSAPESEINKVLADPPAVFDIWIRKNGLAMAHSSIFGEPSSQPQILTMESESPVGIRFRNPNGTVCRGATVTPISVRLASGRWFMIPKPIQDGLKSQTAADGLVNVPGVKGHGLTVSVETAEFGVQILVVSGKSSSPVSMTLRKTRPLKGCITLPKGEKADLSKIKVCVAGSLKDWDPRRCSQGPFQAIWWMRYTPPVDRNGQFTIPNLPVNVRGYITAPLPDEMTFEARCRPRFRFGMGCEDSGLGMQAAIRFGVPAPGLSPITMETTLQIGAYLPTSVAFLTAVWTGLTETKLRIEIPLRKAVCVTRTVRDSQTKRPLQGIRIVVRPGSRQPGEDVFKAIPWSAAITGNPLSESCGVTTVADALKSLITMISPPDEVGSQVATDEQGRIRVVLRPGKTYEMHCELAENYLRGQPGPKAVIQVPVGVNRCELEPIELVRACTIAGRLLDAAGQSVAGDRILATCHRDDAPSKNESARDVSRWATSDAAGQFRFERLEAGTKVTLVPVRAGVALAEPVRIVAGDDKPIRLQEKKSELVALGGRIFGVDRKPIPGARIVVEVEHSPDPAHNFRSTTDSDGSFRTPAGFPKQLKYRLTIRSILKDIVSSAWMCPAASGDRFPDLIVDRSQLKLDSKLAGDEVVALINGRPIEASVSLERAFCDRLRPDGATLWCASKQPTAGRLSEREYRELQDLAIRTHLKELIQHRVHAQALLSALDPSQLEYTEHAVRERWRTYVETMKHSMPAATEQELEQKLQSRGTSLSSVFREFRYQQLAVTYAYRAGLPSSDISGQRALAYYQAHPDRYAEREKVSWQLLEIEFDHPSIQQADHREKPATDGPDPWGAAAKSQEARNVRSVDDGLQINLGSFEPNSDQPNTPPSERNSSLGTTASDKTGSDSNKDGAEIDVVKYADQLPVRLDPRKARGMMDQALARLRKGEPFDAVVKKFSNGPHADQGGWQARISADSLADEKTAAALRQLPEGETSGVIETDYSFRIVRVACRTPACSKPFEEVEESIRQAIHRESEKQALEELYSQTSIESPYIDDISAILQSPPPCTAPQAQDDAFAP